MLRTGRLILIVFILSLKISFGQNENTSVLDKRTGIDARNESIASVLEKISAELNVFFSYDATLVDTEKRVDASLTDKSIREILHLLFESKYVYRALDNQIIITLPEPESEINQTIGKIDTNQSPMIFRGKVFDIDKKGALAYASISFRRANIGTISNVDGEFELKLPQTLIYDTLVVSCIGYKQYRISVGEIGDSLVNVFLQPTTIQLQEIQVVYISPQDILSRLLSKVALNYPVESEIMTSFYREVLTQDNHYIDVAEAILDIKKSPYDNEFSEDKVKYIKGRKSPNVRHFQFVDFKIQGGPYYITQLDVVKTMDAFLNPEYFRFYKYTLEEVVEIDNRDTYVIQFKPTEKIEDQVYQGKLYVDMSSFALVHAEFELSRSGLKSAQKTLIRKKPKDFYVRPIQASYHVSYRRSEGKWHLSNAGTSVNFRVKSKKDQVNSIFHSGSELLVADFKTDDGTRFKKNELFSSNDIFTDVVTDFNENFWGDYNIIKPSEDLREALLKYRQENDSLFERKDCK